MRTLRLDAEANFEADLILRHLAVLHAAADLADLKPLDVAQGLGRARDGRLDGLGHRLLRTTDEIGLPVDVVVLHRSSPCDLPVRLTSALDLSYSGSSLYLSNGRGHA